jgi:hypothetical protein
VFSLCWNPNYLRLSLALAADELSSQCDTSRHRFLQAAVMQSDGRAQALVLPAVELPVDVRTCSSCVCCGSTRVCS